MGAMQHWKHVISIHFNHTTMKSYNFYPIKGNNCMHTYLKLELYLISCFFLKSYGKRMKHMLLLFATHQYDQNKDSTDTKLETQMVNDYMDCC